jgi:hypothetical protein
MIVRYRCGLFSGVLVKSRILLCGLVVGTFILTLAFSSWHDGLWRSGAAPVTRAAPPTGAVASPPFGPTSEAMTTPTAAATPATAAMNPPPAITTPESVQSEPYSTPDVDNAAMPARRDRGAEHGSRSH